MKLTTLIFPIIGFFIGIFIGYYIYKKEEKIKNRRLWGRIERRNIMRTISALVSAIDFKDHLTKHHSDNVRMYACAIAEELGLSKEEIYKIKDACLVHDLGKIGVHDYILTKPDKLNEKEWKEMRLHSLAGAVILKPFRFLDKVLQIVREHHERYDGAGYPDGLAQEKISLGARIMAVADSFDAMISKRPYREKLTKEEAICELKKHSGTQFDPKVVEIFIKLLEIKPEIFKRQDQA
ncbi:MAG: HD-GYP domain-containing protein [Candidatus Omnitrophica bacterium]|nr:HD-GYP domain-containing protein [Candidatus Omnitrophota bacterium]MBU2063696.1 HD-GYP domain-containing protein [Candidatus Omnitrophota bacterium]